MAASASKLPQSPEIWRAREELAAAYRACSVLGMDEGVNNHLTFMVPGRPHHFLVNAFGTAWDEVTAGNLLEVNGEGDVADGEGVPEWDAVAALATAFGVHGELHARGGEERAAVFHTHMPLATALCCRAPPHNRLLMCSQTALRFYGDVAYDDCYDGLVTGKEEGRRLDGLLGSKHVLMLANHGVVTVGHTIADAFFRLYYLEKAAELQLHAESGGIAVQLIGEEVAKAFVAKDLAAAGGTGKDIHGKSYPRDIPRRLWEATKRRLLRSGHGDYLDRSRGSS